MTHPTEAPPVQAQTTIPSVPHVNGVYAVLQALTPGNALMGGWGYLTWTGSVTHEALDLNSMGGGDSDLGAAVVAPLDGVVAWTQLWDGWSDGFGTHLALFVDDPRAAETCYLHVAHLATLKVRVGERVVAGQLLGACGKSGNQGYAHCHAAFWWDTPPGGWNFWQTGYSRDWVAQQTLDPQAWFWRSAEKAGGAGPPTPEVLEMLDDWQVLHWIMPEVWDAAGVPYDPNAGTSKAWLARLREGHYAGRPRTGERPYGEGDQAGVWVEFDQGVVCYRLTDGRASWTG
jgi:hypothetical protein